MPSGLDQGWHTVCGGACPARRVTTVQLKARVTERTVRQSRWHMYGKRWRVCVCVCVCVKEHKENITRARVCVCVCAVPDYPKRTQAHRLHASRTVVVCRVVGDGAAPRHLDQCRVLKLRIAKVEYRDTGIQMLPLPRVSGGAAYLLAIYT